MATIEPLVLAKTGDKNIAILPNKANRHGLVTGATGTGKTVTLQKIAESFSHIGVPVFMADIKGDLSGINLPGGGNPKVQARLELLGLADSYTPEGCPVMFWDVFGEQGHPLRATISEMGPLLLSRMLNLNETQEGVLNICFKIADDNDLMLIDTKDLRALLQYIGDNAKQFTTEYGNVSAASIGAIQRGLLTLDNQGADKFFGEPALDLADMIQTERRKGYVNILAADKLMQAPKLYATFLLWMLSELYENMPEVGDLDKPKMVFFFDEAHLLFDDAPDVLMDKIEQVVRLIRSKGVGVYFVTQNPLDVPDRVLGQLGNRVQHALRAFTPRDQKAVRTAAETFRQNPKINTEQAITELQVGEALVSFLDEKGAPTMVERAFIIPPNSHIGPITDQQRESTIKDSLVYGHYEKFVDRQSAYEVLKDKTAEEAAADQRAKEEALKAKEDERLRKIEEKEAERRRIAEEREIERQRRIAEKEAAKPSIAEQLLTGVAKSAARNVTSSIGREITRGILGGLLGGSSRSRSRW
jgi:hypothetical protein